jgi:putative ATP-dependent endonuclease of the OLD family
MARIRQLRVEGYRSIGDPIEIDFPSEQPVVVVGENNAGKSNIVKALQLILGPFWPGNHEPEDHEFFGRDRGRQIEIQVEFDPAEPLGNRYTQVVWRYEPTADEPVFFRGKAATGYGWGYIRNDDRDTCMCVVVEAERNLGYHLSYASKWTLLSRLMHRFHRALGAQEPVRDDLEGLFEEIKKKFQEVPEFKAFVDDLQEQMQDLVSTMSHKLEVDFEAYNPVNFFHALRLQAAEENKPRTLEEMGTGEQQVLALAFAHAYARAFHGGLVLVVEEPEAHLHPLAQQWLARRLRSQCREGLQLVITTHSPAFVDVEGLEGLVLVYKQNSQTRVRQLGRGDLVANCVELGAPRERVNEDNVLPFYAANATTDLISGFFARAVVLVEGQTEVLALPRLFAKRGLQVEREGIAVLGVGGKGNIAKWSRLYTAYGIPCYLVFDNDPQDDEAGDKRRDALRSIGLDGAELDPLIETEDWLVQGAYTIFGTDFETSLRANFGSYAELEENAKLAAIESKPFVARWIVERLDPSTSDIGWTKVGEMVEAIRSNAQANGTSQLETTDDPDIPF